MKFTAITAAFVIAFASAQKSGAAPPEVSGVPSFAAHPTGVFTPGASGFAHPSGHHKHPHHRPSGFSGFAFPTGVWPTGFPHHHPSGHRSSHGPYMPVPIKTAPAGAAPTGTVQRRQEMSGVPEVPSGVPSGFPSGVAHTGAPPAGIPAGPPSGIPVPPSGAPVPPSGVPTPPSGLPAGPGGPEGTAPPHMPPVASQGAGGERPTGTFPSDIPHGSGRPHHSGHPHPSGGFTGIGGHSGATRPTAAPSFGGAGAGPVGPSAVPSGFQTLRRV